MNERTNWISEKTINELNALLEAGEVTSRQIVLTYFERIATIDSSGPTLNSLLELNPDALHLADQLDTERQAGKKRGILHGIPVILKDNIDTNDKLHTSAGSLLLKDHVAQEDAFVAKQLKEAGAIILGKANMTEWANFIADDMPTGYSSRGGQTLNPYGKDFIVGGPSAGTGAAVAANLVVAGIGTETSGSILSPASQNSLVGIKPTVGLISRSGIIPISFTQDTAGPMTRTVEDAAILLSVLQGKDDKDAITSTNPLLKTIFTDHLLKDGLKGKRIGIAREPFFDYVDQDKQQLINQAIDVLKESGAEVIENVNVPTAEESWTIDLMVYEFKSAIESYLKTVEPTLGLNTLDDLIKGNRALGTRALKYGQSLFYQAAATSGQLTEPAYLNSLIFDQENAREKGIDAVLQNEQLDAIVTPNNAGAMIPAKAGYPSITVPAGYTPSGEPVGITFSGGAFAEPVLLECAYAFEQATHHRKAPRLQ
ncbi:amidase family protein [Marinilactibacillus kalidii]|uniref:amidase family protein n=1 Tax=Marinilactibacillus kalidii TaxID=2820274 RepID=UPI001ABED451|nr:amidase family protein [Marinilactibacillus kalidii]